MQKLQVFAYQWLTPSTLRAARLALVAALAVVALVSGGTPTFADEDDGGP